MLVDLQKMLYDDLQKMVYDGHQKIIKTILELIIKTDVIVKCQFLSKIDISDWNNFKKRTKIHLGFQTEKELRSLLQKDLITR